METNLTVGKIAPFFSLPDQTGAVHSLSEYKGQWVVLYFYPKDNTPGCTIEAIEFTAKIKSFEKLEAIVLGVSPDSPKSHCNFIEKQNLKILLLSDSEKTTLKDYGAFGKKMMYGKEVEGIIRSTALIDPEGKIAFHWSRVKAEGHAGEVLEKLKELKSRQA